MRIPTGIYNTASGVNALQFNTTGSGNDGKRVASQGAHGPILSAVTIPPAEFADAHAEHDGMVQHRKRRERVAIQHDRQRQYRPPGFCDPQSEHYRQRQHCGRVALAQAPN